MKTNLILAAFFALPALAQDVAPAADAGAPAPAPAAEASALAPSRPVPPTGKKSRFESLSPEEQAHIRRMAGFRKSRDEAERELLRVAEKADKRKEDILAENEEAMALHKRIQELQAEFATATNALETIYRADETLAGLVKEAATLQKAVDSSQASLNQEVSAAMQIRMNAQRAAYEKAHPAPAPLEGAALTNLPVRSSAPSFHGRTSVSGPAIPKPFVPGAPVAPAAPAAPSPAAPAAPAPTAE
jgi:hypothetical protein